MLLITSGVQGLYGQSEVLSSGGDASGSGGSASYSIGQVAYTHYGGENGSVSLGVQQPYLIIMVGTGEPDISVVTSVYPNPMSSIVNLKIDSPFNTNKKLFFGLYDLNGKLYQQNEIISNMTTIAMDKLAAGVYILRVSDLNTVIKTFKIYKTN